MVGFGDFVGSAGDMEIHPEKGVSPDKALTEKVRILRYTCSSILNDESFRIPAGEASEMCIRMSKSLINSLSNPSQCSLQFATWLICELQEILENCKHKSGIFNQEKLWSTFPCPITLKKSGQLI